MKWILVAAVGTLPTPVTSGSGASPPVRVRVPSPSPPPRRVRRPTSVGVALVNDRGTARALTETDSAGAFTLHAPSTGVYWLRALPLGHAPVLSRPFVLERGDSLALPLRALEVYMQPEFVPPQLSMAPFNSCGAVALWTHHGLGIE